jgi:hypothetical protein
MNYGAFLVLYPLISSSLITEAAHKCPLNVLAKWKVVPINLVMPNDRAQKNDRPEGNIYASATVFAAFDQCYSVQVDQSALAYGGPTLKYPKS